MFTTNISRCRRCNALGVNFVIQRPCAALFGLLFLGVVWNLQATPVNGEFELVHQGAPHDIVYGIAAKPAELVAVGTAGILLRSRDGGTWTLERLATGGKALFAVATGEAFSVAVGQEGLAMVNDSGKSDAKYWTAVDTPTSQRLFSVAIDSKGNAAAVGGFGTILVSDSQGKNWQARSVDWEKLINQPYEPHIYKVAFDSSDRLLMTGEFGMIARSEDLGQSWTLLRKGDASIFDLAQSGKNTLYAVGQNGEVLHSKDAGETWVRLNTNTNGVLLNALVASEAELIVFGLRENLGRNKLSKKDLQIIPAVSALGNAWYTDSVFYGDAHYAVGQFGRIVKIRN